MKKRPKFVIYMRVSSKGQAKEKTIIQQWQFLQDYLAQDDTRVSNGDYEFVPRKLGLKVTDMNAAFVDNPFNLETWDEEKAYYDVLRRVQQGEIDFVLMFDTDRLFRSRDAELRGRIVNIFENAEARVISAIDDEILTASQCEERGIANARAKKQWAHRGQLGKIDKARERGQPPCRRGFFGASFHEDEGWRLVETEAEIVRWTANAAVGRTVDSMPTTLKLAVVERQNGVSLEQVAKILSTADVSLSSYHKRMNLKKYAEKNPQGEIRSNFLCRFFEDDRYAGNYVVFMRQPNQVGATKWKGMPRDQKKAIAINVPPVLDATLLETVRKHLGIRRNTSKRNTKREYLLQKHIFCSECGGTVVVRHGGKVKTNQEGEVKTYRSYYYVCSSRATKTKQPCQAKKTHNADKLDQAVWAQMEKVLEDRSLIEAIEQSANALEAVTPVETLRKEQIKVESQAKALQVELTNVDKHLLSGFFTMERAQAQADRIKKEMAETERTTRQLARRIEQQRALEASYSVKDFIQIRERYCGQRGNFTFAGRREALQIATTRVMLSPDGRFVLRLRPFVSQSI